MTRSEHDANLSLQPRKPQAWTQPARITRTRPTCPQQASCLVIIAWSSSPGHRALPMHTER